MIRCSKCDLLKEDDQYSTYFHSKQQKWRTRKVCKSCYSNQNKEYKKRLKETIPTKTCSVCLKTKPLETEFYKLRSNYLKICKQCRKERREVEMGRYYRENGGYSRYFPEPNQYTDEFQREQIFMVMDAIGWSFNEDNGIWYKPGLKESDGSWNPNLVFKVEIKRRKSEKLKQKQQEIRESIPVIRRMLNEGKTIHEVAAYYNLTYQAIEFRLKHYEKKD